MRAGIVAKQEAAESELSKLVKDAPSVDLEQKAVAEAKTSFELARQARKDRELRGNTKAAERMASRLEHLQGLKDQITKLEAGVQVWTPGTLPST